MPTVEVGGALRDVGCYEFGDYEIVYCCVVIGSLEVRREGVVFYLIFVGGVYGGGEEAVIFYEKCVVIEEV